MATATVTGTPDASPGPHCPPGPGPGRNFGTCNSSCHRNGHYRPRIHEHEVTVRACEVTVRAALAVQPWHDHCRDADSVTDSESRTSAETPSPPHGAAGPLMMAPCPRVRRLPVGRWPSAGRGGPGRGRLGRCAVNRRSIDSERSVGPQVAQIRRSPPSSVIRQPCRCAGGWRDVGAWPMAASASAGPERSGKDGYPSRGQRRSEVRE